MHATGIICEYNPFHNGHQYHIEQTRFLTQCDVLVCVMSGNFVQRGEPAIIDKWTRTEAALHHGVDLVIELPFAFATQSATQFAQGAISSLQCAYVKDIVFGSESNDLSTLQSYANIDVTNYREYMIEGTSCARAYASMYGALHPNDILAVNYLKALKNTLIQAHCIQRTNDYHDEKMMSSIASATSIRKSVYNQIDVTNTTCMAKQLTTNYAFENYYPFIQSLLLSLSPTYLKTLFLMDEGIEMHLIKCAKQCDSLPCFLQMATTKRYSTSRIRRTLIHLLNQTKKEDIDTLSKLQHIRILGFNTKGKQYLKYLKDKDSILVTKFNQLPYSYQRMELKATQMYGCIHERKNLVTRELQPPVIVL